jgi:hypothetical protein
MKVLISFLAGAIGYLSLFIGCVGSESGSPLSGGCSTIGPLLRTPLFYWLPYANSRYWGIDSMFLALAGNMLFWGIVVSACCFAVVRLRDTSTAKTE